MIHNNSYRTKETTVTPCKRKCWDCGNVADHEGNITPHVNCKKCGSQDTRLVKPKPSECKHESFACSVAVNRIPEVEGGPIKNYSADVRVQCSQCQLPFRFIGLPYELDLRGASVSVDGTEGRFAIAPNEPSRSQP